MPPRRRSRYTFTQAIVDADGNLYLTDREPYRYRPFADNRQHVVEEGDTLFTLAAHYFSPLPRPSGMWWVIADFQPDPIHDPTLALGVGSVIHVPSIRVLTGEIFGEGRRDEI